MNSRISQSARHWTPLARYSNALVGGAIVCAGLALLVALWLGWIDILPYTSQVGDNSEAPPPTAAPNVVELTPEKLTNADLHLAEVQPRAVQPTRPVPGEIAYDQERRVPV